MDPQNHPRYEIARDVLNDFVPNHAPNLTPAEMLVVKRYLDAKMYDEDDDVTDMPHHREVNGAFEGYLVALHKKYDKLTEAQWEEAAASTWWEYHFGDGLPYYSELSALCASIGNEMDTV